MPTQPPAERTVAVAPNHTVSVRIARNTPQYQTGLDAFLRSTIASYSTSTGNVKVAPTFAMGDGYGDQQDAKKDGSPTHAALARLASSAGLSSTTFKRLQVGRGTPNEFRTFTQAAITSMGMASSVTWQALDIRTMMHGNATGFDCAGYVQQAYLFATGRTRDQLGWAELSSEGLFNLPGHGFRKFQKVGDLRSGDIIVFKATDPRDRIEHRTIVFDQRVANDDDSRAIAGAIGRSGPAPLPSGAEFTGTAATIRVLEMDSSYGSGGHPDAGGVQRQKWLFNEATSKWAFLRFDDSLFDPTAHPATSAPRVWRIAYMGGLYGMLDVLEGFYRHRAD